MSLEVSTFLSSDERYFDKGCLFASFFSLPRSHSTQLIKCQQDLGREEVGRECPLKKFLINICYFDTRNQSFSIYCSF